MQFTLHETRYFIFVFLNHKPMFDLTSVVPHVPRYVKLFHIELEKLLILFKLCTKSKQSLGKKTMLYNGYFLYL